MAGRYSYKSFNGNSAQQVIKACPICGGKILAGKWGPWCPTKTNGVKCRYRPTAEEKAASMPAQVSRPSTITRLATPSAEQKAIFDLCESLEDNLIINALAGTGKTTTMVQIADILSSRGKSVLCLAFTKRDRQAMEAKIPESVAKVWTSNAAGLAIVSHYAKKRGSKVTLAKGNMAFDTLMEIFKSDGLVEADGTWTKEAKSLAGPVPRLVSYARTTLELSAATKPRPTDKDWEDLATRFGIEVKSDMWQPCVQYCSVLFSKMASLEHCVNSGLLDYDNMVFLPVYHDLSAPYQFDFVLVDEAQDQSFCNRMIAEKYRKKSKGRIIAVGDHHQAIYAWRGADVESMEMMKSLMKTNGGKVYEMPLNECRRCAKSIIDQAKLLVPEIKALDKAPEGQVKSIATDVEFVDHLKEVRKGLVLCRANAPSISLCLKLLQNMVPAIIVRSNVITDILQLVKNAEQSVETETCPIDKVLQYVEEWRMDKISKLSQKSGNESAVQLVQDKADCVNALCMADGVKSSADLRKKLDQMFPEDEADRVNPDKLVVFSTVHGAKGGEADEVYLYSPNDPNAKSKTTLWDSVWTDATDRNNVLYVALTRAKHTLVFAGLPPTMVRLEDGVQFDQPKIENPDVAVKETKSKVTKKPAAKKATAKKTPAKKSKK